MPRPGSGRASRREGNLGPRNQGEGVRGDVAQLFLECNVETQQTVFAGGAALCPAPVAVIAAPCPAPAAIGAAPRPAPVVGHTYTHIYAYIFVNTYNNNNDDNYDTNNNNNNNILQSINL